MEQNQLVSFVNDAIKCEESLGILQLLKNEYEQYALEPVEPTHYKNVASLGMITLPVTWTLFDIFAFATGHPKIGIGSSIATVALYIFWIVMKIREKKLNEETMERFHNYQKKHQVWTRVEVACDDASKTIAVLYELEYLYPRFCNYNSLMSMKEAIESGAATAVSGTDSVFNYCDKLRSKGEEKNWKKELQIPVKSDEEIQKYCQNVEEQNAKIRACYKAEGQEV